MERSADGWPRMNKQGPEMLVRSPKTPNVDRSLDWSFLKKWLKNAAMSALPSVALKVFSIRSRRLIESQVHNLGLDRMAREISAMTGATVAAGPFAGMKLDYEIFPTHAAPKFLGTYEQELHQVIEKAIARSPRFVLNVGCAEGYYAVGMALRLKDAAVFAADADPKALRATVKNAQLNGVRKQVLPVGIICSGQLRYHLQPDQSFLIMDCEGAEFTLLDPHKDPILSRTAVLVEVHDEFGSKAELMRRFSSTHQVTEISPIARSAAKIEVASTTFDVLDAADERRGEHTSWLFLEPKGS
jgi:Ribosomal protein L11 methyltransferase (PrmA)